MSEASPGQAGASQACCVCGHPLPNRYAVAGACAEPGCEASFCLMHWRHGNRRCPQHGWQPETAVAPAPRPPPAGPQPGSPPPPPPPESPGRASLWQRLLRLWLARKKMAQPEQAPVEETTNMTEKSKSGGVSSALKWIKSKIWKDPAIMRQELEAKAASNRAEIEKNDAEERRLFEAVRRTKAEYEKAPPARREKLGLDLKALISRHKSALASHAVLLENETVLNKALSAMQQAAAYNNRGLTTRDMDRIIDTLEAAAGEADDIALVVADLDSAGKRTVKAADGIDLDSELAGYGTEPAAAEPLEHDLAAYESAPERPGKKQTAERPQKESRD